MIGWRCYIVYLVFSFLPATRCFSFKRCLLRWAGALVGDNVKVVSSARFYLGGGALIIGDGTWIGHEVLIVGGNAAVRIGKNCDIAPRVTFVTGTHELFTIPGRAAGAGYSLPILVEDGSWIGVGVTILGGVHIGKGSMVAAGSLVKNNVPDNESVGGVPARTIVTSAKPVNDAKM